MQGISFASVHAVVGERAAVGAGECCGSIEVGAGECCGSIEVGAGERCGSVEAGHSTFLGELTAVGAGECCGSIEVGAGECSGSVEVGASSEAGKVGVGLANFVGGSFEPGAKRDAPFGSLHDRAHFEFMKTGMRSHSPRAAHWAHGTFGASASGPTGTDAIGLKIGLPEVGAPRGVG